MKHVKKLFPALLTLVLLTGCGRDRYTLETTLRLPTGDDIPQNVSPLPETSPAGTISAPALVTEGRVPTVDFELPTEILSWEEWDGSGPLVLLAELPEQDVALYGMREYPAGGNVVWLCWGDALAEFDWNFGAPPLTMPALWCFDADNDGQEEVVAVTCGGTGTGIYIEVLHMVGKNEDGKLTDHTFPVELWQDQLSELLDFAVISDTAYAVLGEEAVDITGQLPIAPEELNGLNTGAICRFGVGYPDSMDIYFNGSAGIRAEKIASNVYVADISAAVSYADGTFTLSDFHLHSFDD